MNDPLQIEDKGEVRWIWFNRPEVHNAQNVAMLKCLDTAIEETSNRVTTKVLVIGGRGKSFCSGHDLREISDNAAYATAASTAEGRFEQEMRLFSRPVQRMMELPIPVVCRVHGNCVAGALMFVAAADLVVAADDSVFRSPILSSLAINDAEVPALAWLLGERRAKQFLWLDEQLGPQDAYSAGLVNWVVPSDNLDEEVDKIVTRLLGMPAAALRLSKLSLRYMADRQGRADFFAFHFLSHQFSHQTSESKQALAERVARIDRGERPFRA